MAISKRKKALAGKVDRALAYPAIDAMKLIKETATAKFDESVDVAVNLGIDAKKTDQSVRGSVVLPSGTGKSVRVAVFAQGDRAQAAKAAGADIVGFEDLAEAITTSNSILPPLTVSARSSKPTMSAPAAFAACALSPCANTATRTDLPVPEGSTTEPRTD